MTVQQNTSFIAQDLVYKTFKKWDMFLIQAGSGFLLFQQIPVSLHAHLRLEKALHAILES